MKLGLSIGYWGSGPPPGVVEQIKAAEDLGFDSMWTAEAYGSDALTPLAWYGAHTSKMRLGTSIMQLSARTPAATAMAAMTMDHLSGGRFVLGLGASGPQVVEGWYGQPYPRPLERTRPGAVRRHRDDREPVVDQRLEVRALAGDEDADHARTTLPITSASAGSSTTAQ